MDHDGFDLPTIGGKANILDVGRLVPGWFGMPVWQREEIMRAIQARNAEIEAQEKKRRQQEEAERLANMGRKRAEAVPAASKYKQYADEGLFPFADLRDRQTEGGFGDLTGSVPVPDYLRRDDLRPPGARPPGAPRQIEDLSNWTAEDYFRS